jgi:hypothetical protein
MVKKNLRNYSTYTVLKNISNPVMFLGLPMKLALIFLVVIMLSSFLAMILKTMEIPLIFNIGIPGGLAFLGIGIVRGFFKKYGVKGFSMSQRNKNLPDTIKADKTIQEILK